MRALVIALGLIWTIVTGPARAAGPEAADRSQAPGEIERLAAEVTAAAKVARQMADPRIDAGRRAAWLERMRPEARRRALRAARLAERLRQPAGYRAAAGACRAYLDGLEGAQPDRAVRRALAGALRAQQAYLPAARLYQALAGGGQGERSDRDLLLAAQACLKAALGSGDLSPADRAEAGVRFDRASARFLQDHPDDPEAPAVRFDRGRVFFDLGELRRAREELWSFIDRHPAHRLVADAGHLILEIFHQQEDYRGLAKAASRLLGDERIQDAAFKQELHDIIRWAETRFIQLL